MAVSEDEYGLSQIEHKHPKKKIIPTWPTKTPKTALELERERRREFERQQEELKASYEVEEREQILGGIQPQPRYRPSFYERLGGLRGSRPYLDWFESMFPSLVHEFESKLPTYTGFKTAEIAMEEAGKIEKDWSKWLRGKQPESRERWWSLAPAQRGERPWSFAPPIRTVKF